MTHLPTVVWRLITSTLSPFDRKRFIQTHKNAQNVFTTNELRNISFWNKIFLDDVWVNKVISHGLYPAVIGNIGEDDPYLILILINEGLNTDVDQNFTHAKYLLKSLRSKLYSVGKQEVKFDDFTLHVGEIFEASTAAIDVTDPKKLYREKNWKAIIIIPTPLCPKACRTLNQLAVQENRVFANRVKNPYR